MSAKRDPATGEQRDGIDLTNLDQPLSPDADASKRDLVDYLDAVADRILPGLVGRPLTVLRVLRGRAPFMQKNVPKYTPARMGETGMLGFTQTTPQLPFKTTQHQFWHHCGDGCAFGAGSQ